MNPPHQVRLGKLVVWATSALAVAWFVITRYLATFSEAINWDEFALLGRADITLRTGVVQGSGRPGLVTIILVPFVRDCIDSVQAVVHARLLWHLITLAYLAGVYALVRRWFRFAGQPDSGRFEATVAVALLAFLPAFVTWSIQVRTDQAALAAATWGGVLLMSAGALPAGLGGVLFGAGLLSSQKGLYVVALAALLLASGYAARLSAGDITLRRLAADASKRILLASLGAVAILVLYSILVPETVSLVSPQKLAASFDTMNWYRDRMGFKPYTIHAPRLWAHWALLAFLAIWTLAAFLVRDRTHAVRLATCWAILALGLAVIVIHGSRLSYFVMTAGLFPAVALGIASGGVRALIGRHEATLLTVMIGMLMLQSLPETLEVLSGTQRHQTDTMRLINESELRGMRGYQVENALFCSADRKPIREMFAPQIYQLKLRGPNAFDDFLEEFRRRPIAYIVESYRMQQFPINVREFWHSHYVPYGEALLVAGFQVPPDVHGREIDVIVPGSYRWLPGPDYQRSHIEVGGLSVGPGETVLLESGIHSIVKPTSNAAGTLVLAVTDAPMRDAHPFYDPRQVRRIRAQQ